MVFNAKNVLWISNILKKIKENHWKLEKKMLNRCRQRKTRWQKGLEVLEDFGRFKTFGIWWKMSEYIIGSAQLALWYID